MSLHAKIIAAAVGLFASVASASVILNPVSVVEPPGVGSFGFINTINQSGLNVTYVSGVTDFDAYAALNPTHSGNNTTEGYTDAEPSVNFDFDLGASFEVGGMALWFSRFPQSANPSSITVLSSLTSDFAAAVNVGSFFPDDGRTGSIASPSPMQFFDLTDSDARYMRVTVNDKFDNFGIFFAEIAFVTVPEPANLSLLGLAGMVLLGRRSRQS